ncbi:hypothetical protein UFOVP1382_40 [uncultured Caudovirales phage]|uniref:Uncharacterized protein n=1 Tax=uncultured Caudovirales phage TaxID=2100421 RepID=A0A6J5RXS8_9CAUD|nr:hypothetical protein UFOVP1382_40 [uncultured Caudovirales phage]
MPPSPREAMLEAALRALLETLKEGEFTEHNGSVCYIVEANDVALAKAKAAKVAAEATAAPEPVYEAAAYVKPTETVKTLEDHLADIWGELA